MAEEKLPDSPSVIRLVAPELFEPEDLEEMLNMCHEEAGKYAEDVAKHFSNSMLSDKAWHQTRINTVLRASLSARYVTEHRYRIFALALLDRMQQSNNFVATLRQLPTQGLTAISQYELASVLAFPATILITARAYQYPGNTEVPLSLLSNIALSAWEAIGG